ncbi:response regulator [Alteraurantiacibacter aquimixticola]|uniref:Response regulator transcription factor n=1 Tax=Alteraurantiacibacter aquimixticola TaxID=2489173 RepID=A0A4T3F5K1_9SPHN|nr:response regulator transcription factor [Alteraurantiacibacter aquimixticola]TIX51664.1 response regulator transcription factor [Alteraurantiacibacter aquimixticola]
MNILIVDDEPSIIETLRPVLSSLGHDVIDAANGAEALNAIEGAALDLVLLDLGLPDTDGCDLIAPVKDRAKASLIVISARHLEKDKVRALDLGADDYVDKPFGLDELLARIRVVERRRAETYGAAVSRYQSDDLVVDFGRREVILMDEPIHLSPKEFALFELLVRNSGHVVTQRQLMIAGWSSPTVDGQYLRSYMSMLRDKLEADPSDPELILTEPGVGYRLAIMMEPQA